MSTFDDLDVLRSFASVGGVGGPAARHHGWWPLVARLAPRTTVAVTTGGGMLAELAAQASGSGDGLTAWLLDVAGNLGQLAIYVTIGAAAWRYWQQTLGRPRELARRLNGLSPLMQVDRLIEQLGVPAVRARGEGEEEDLTWIHPDAFIRAVAVRGTVSVLAVTTRSRWFRPTFFRGVVISQEGDSLEVTLGKTTYGDLSFRPSSIYADVGARRWGYSEVFYHGNPGGYMTQMYAINEAGWIPRQNGELLRALLEAQWLRAEQPTDGSDILDQLPQDVVTPRDRAVFNTIAITKPNWGGDSEQLGFTPGADNDVVRLVDLVGGRSRAQVVAARVRDHLPGG